ncbi:MAG: response regulator [Deltaproteobacteria bacterium]|nr:MAG: response regulator [Deltaproteobacteria bacterium]
MSEDFRNVKVLVVDDEQPILELLCEVLERRGFDVYPASDGEQGIEIFKRENPTVVLTDIKLPRASGIEILKFVKKVSPITQVIMISGYGTTDDVIKALRLGACDYLMKPFNVGILVHTVIRSVERYELIMERISRQETLEKEVRERTAALTNTFHETVKALGLLTEKRDPYTAGHQNRVALLAMGIGRKLGLTPKELDVIQVASLLHDIGKVAVPVELLTKPTKLSLPEAELIKSHPQAGYDIIKDIPFVDSLGKDVSIIVLQHHERLDGSGYPRGLKSEELELESKILSVSDVVEAMSSHRPYRAAMDMESAKAEIAEGSGKIYSPECVDACLLLIEEHKDNNGELFGYLAQYSRRIHENL